MREENHTPTAEELEKERADAEAAFAAADAEQAAPAASAPASEGNAASGDGAAAAAGGEQSASASEGAGGAEKKPGEDDTAGAGATGGETKAAEPDPWEGVPPIVRQTLESINGKVGAVEALRREVGGFNGRITKLSEQLTTAATQAAKDVRHAPTQAQIAEAAKSTAKWEQQKQDFPEWAEAMEERLAAEREAIRAAAPQSQAVDVDNIRNSVLNEVQASQADVLHQARQFARLDNKYPTWETEVKSEDFQAWHKTQPPEIRALAASDNADDAISMLDKFYEHRKAVRAQIQKRQQLERAIPPKGSTSQRQITSSEQEEMMKAFSSA